MGASRDDNVGASLVGKIEKDALDRHEKRKIDIDKRYTWLDRDSDTRRISRNRHEKIEKETQKHMKKKNVIISKGRQG